MWANALKAVGLAPVEDYIHPRLSIGDRVLGNELSTGHFKIHVDSEQLKLVVKNSEGRIVWQSIHNEPFLSSTVGIDDFGSTTEPTVSAGVFTPVVEHDTLATRLQTITRIAYDETDKSMVNIFGGLSQKLVLPTHLDYKLSFKEINPKQLELSIKILGCDHSMEKYKRLLLTYLSRKEESFYGFGEQFCAVDHKGQKVPILVREQGKGRTTSSATTLWSSTFNAISGDSLSSNCVAPFYMTSDNRGFYLTNTEYSSFDLQNPDRVVVRVDSTTLTARLIDGPSLLDLLTEYTSHTGRVQSLPNWVGKGAITEIQGGEEKVRQIVQRLHFYKVPLAAVCISDWTGHQLQPTPNQQERRRSSSSSRDTALIKSTQYTLEHDAHIYPDWYKLLQELTQKVIPVGQTGEDTVAATLAVTSDNDSGDLLNQQQSMTEHEPKTSSATYPPVRVLVNISPFLSNTNDPSISNLFNQAKDEGYLIKSTDPQNLVMIATQPGNNVGMIDLTNPKARQWLKCILKKQIFDNGISGYIADYGNTLPMNSAKASLFSNQDPAAYHNQYAEDWSELHMNLFKEFDLDDNDAVCFVRSGFTRSPGKMQVLSTGDHYVTWDSHDGIKSAVTAMVTAGLSGFSVSHCDIGGYITADGGYPGTRMTRNRDLLFRWMELAAFTAVFKTTEGLIPGVNAQFYDNEESYSHLAHTAKLFVSLEPYRKQLLKEAQTKGWPLIRHLILYYPQDDKVKQMTWQQFLLGSALMVAPTLSPTSFVKVYFPKDSRNITWRHIWTDNVYEADGSYQAVDTPLGQPAAFVMEPRDGQTGSDQLLPLLKFASSYYESLSTARPTGDTDHM